MISIASRAGQQVNCAYTDVADLSGLIPLETDTFTYADSNWKDKLTGYNGTTIEYDAIGNPTKAGTKTGEEWENDT